MHIYRSALLWTPTSSLTKKLYESELMIETKLLNAVETAWDACIRTIPLGWRARELVFSPSSALMAAHAGHCAKVFDTVTGVNRATFNEEEPIHSVTFSPDDVTCIWT